MGYKLVSNLLAVLGMMWLLTGTVVAKEESVQSLLYLRSPHMSSATIAMQCWSDFAKGPEPPVVQIVGTGFLISKEGYFLTAAHVINTTQVGGTPCQLKALIRQADNSGFAAQFKIVEVDKDHDLALGKISGFAVHSRNRPSQVEREHPNVVHPFASLRVSSSEPRQGEMVVLSGYPLSSYVQALHLGLISATSTLYVQVPTSATKDFNELLQVTIDGNHGDSGGPIVDLSSGQVVGMLLQIVPAPLVVNGGLRYDNGNYSASGIMLAAPAKWMNALLQRNHVSSFSQPPGTLNSF